MGQRWRYVGVTEPAAGAGRLFSTDLLWSCCYISVALTRKVTGSKHLEEPHASQSSEPPRKTGPVHIYGCRLDGNRLIGESCLTPPVVTTS